MTTKDKILSAAVDVLSSDSGASLGKIAQHAAVGRATLHRHFPSRDDLLRALALMCLEDIDDATQDIGKDTTDAAEVLRRLLDATVPLGRQFRFLWADTTVHRDPEVTDVLKRQTDELAQFIEFAKEQNVIASDLPTPWIAASIDSVIWTAWDAVHAGYLSSRDAPVLAYQTLLQGISPDIS